MVAKIYLYAYSCFSVTESANILISLLGYQ